MARVLVLVVGGQRHSIRAREARRDIGYVERSSKRREEERRDDERREKRRM